MIVLSNLEMSSKKILASNLSLHSTSLALVSATYFDPTVDVPPTLIASMFSVLFSTYRITSYDLPLSFLCSKSALKVMSRASILDIFFRTCLVVFNLRIWLTISLIQNDPSICPEGSSEWAFFSKTIDLRVPSLGSRMAYTYCTLDIAWEGLRYVAGVVWFYIYQNSHSSRKGQVCADARYWILRKLGDTFSNNFCHTRASEGPPRFNCLPCLSNIHKGLVWLYVVINVEKMVSANDLKSENFWTFGQIFATVNLFGLLGVLIGHFLPSSVDFSLE